MYSLKHNLGDEVCFMIWSNPTPIKNDFGSFTMQRVQIRASGKIKEIQIIDENIKYLVITNDNSLVLINSNEIL